MTYKIGFILSKKDLKYNMENYGKKGNLLFVTGMVGAGKSTISREISKKYNSKILSQDWLGWSEVYKDDKFANEILDEFYTICPKAKEAALNNYWHTNQLSKSERSDIRIAYNQFLIDYAKKHPENLYIIEGIDVYKAIPASQIKDKSIIFKRSSAIRCFIRRYKRDKTSENQNSIKNKFAYLKMVIRESKIYYFPDRKKLNTLMYDIFVS